MTPFMSAMDTKMMRRITLSGDDDTNALFDRAIDVLQARFEYSEIEAVELTKVYFETFKNVHDVDFFHHEEGSGIAERVHYFIGLNGDPRGFIEWRTVSNLERMRRRGRGESRGSGTDTGSS
jgi:hypothetical protein